MKGSILSIVAALALTLACGGSTAINGTETPPPSATVANADIRDFARELIRYDHDGLKVEFIATGTQDEGPDADSLVWRIAGGQLRLDEVKAASSGGSLGTLLYDPAPETKSSFERFFCDWDASTGNGVWIDCLSGLGTHGRQTIDFVYLLLSNGNITSGLPSEDIAGRRADCYVVRYIWQLSPTDAKLCVDPELHVPLLMEVLETGVGFRAAQVVEGSQGILKPDVGPDGSYGEQPIDVLRLPGSSALGS